MPSLRQKTRKKLIAEVEQTWGIENEQKKLTCSFNIPSISPNPLIQKTKNIVLPKIHFVDSSLSQIVQGLSDLSEQFDTEGIGVNILLIDPHKKDPKLTLQLKNISFYKALRYVARAADFNLSFDSDAIVFSEEKEVSTIFFPVARGTVIQIVENSNEKTSQDIPEEVILKRFFQKSGINFDVPGSNFAFDGSQFIVTHNADYLKKFENILERYQNIQQVSIEAKFLEVQQGALEEIWFKWRLGENSQAQLQTGNDSTNNLRSLSALNISSSSSGDGFLIANGKEYTVSNRAPSFPNSLNLGSNTTPTANILGVLNGYQMRCFLQALEQRTDTDLMSAPKLTVLSGKKAEIVVAQELRYPERYGDSHSEVGSNYTNGAGSAVGAAGVTITAGTPLNFVTRNVGVEMSVLPTVERNNCISLKLEPSVTEFEGFVEYGGSHVAVAGGNTVRIPSGFFQPIFSRRQIKTEVTIFNGATVVMGGLTREEVKEVNDKVPILGNIPLLGNLFRSKGHTSQKRNLLIFVTANLLKPDGLPLVAVEN